MTPPTPTAWLRGAGSIPFGRHEGQGPIDLMAAATRQALESSGLARGDIDGVLGGYATTLPHLMLSTLLCERLGLAPRYAHGMQLGGATGAAMLMAARELVRAGRCRNVLVVAGENRLTGQSRDSSIQTLAQVGDADYEVPNGASVPDPEMIARMTPQERAISFPTQPVAKRAAHSGARSARSSGQTHASGPGRDPGAEFGTSSSRSSAERAAGRGAARAANRRAHHGAMQRLLLVRQRADRGP